MKTWLGDFDAMLAAIEEDREQSVRARAEASPRRSERS
jgi:hypothetical protein